MADTPIIRVEVDDTQLNQLIERLENLRQKPITVGVDPTKLKTMSDSYAKLLKAASESAKVIDATMAGALVSMTAMVHQLRSVSVEVRHTSTGMERFGRSVHKSNEHVTHLGKSFHKAFRWAHRLEGVARSLGDVFLGTGTIGGLGFGAQALSATNHVIASRHLINTSVGQREAFQTAFTRVLPSSFLQGVAGSQLNPAMVPSIAFQSGQNVQSVRDMSTSALAIQELRRFHAFFAREGHNIGAFQSSNPAVAPLLSQGLSMQALQMVGNLSNSELNSLLSRAQNPRTIGELNLSHTVGNRDQRLLSALEAGFRSIGANIERRLSLLDTGAGSASTAFMHALNTLIDGALSPQNVAIINRNLIDFAHVLQNTNFETALQGMGKELGKFFADLTGFGRALDWVMHLPFLRGFLPGSSHGGSSNSVSPPSAAQVALHGQLGIDKYRNDFLASAARYGVSANALAQTAMVESGGNPNAVNNGAFGFGQIKLSANPGIHKTRAQIMHPATNIAVMARLRADDMRIARRYSDQADTIRTIATAMYYAGPSAIEKRLAPMLGMSYIGERSPTAVMRLLRGYTPANNSLSVDQYILKTSSANAPVLDRLSGISNMFYNERIRSDANRLHITVSASPGLNVAAIAHSAAGASQ